MKFIWYSPQKSKYPLCILIDLWFNPLYTVGLFHCCMLDESIRHLRGVGSILSLLFYFWWKILLANNVDPDQTSHSVASDLVLHCHIVCLWPFYGFPDKNGLNTKMRKIFRTNYPNLLRGRSFWASLTIWLSIQMPSEQESNLIGLVIRTWIGKSDQLRFSHERYSTVPVVQAATSVVLNSTVNSHQLMHSDEQKCAVKHTQILA